jgi:hypothetical protein
MCLAILGYSIMANLQSSTQRLLKVASYVAKKHLKANYDEDKVRELMGLPPGAEVTKTHSASLTPFEDKVDDFISSLGDIGKDFAGLVWDFTRPNEGQLNWGPKGPFAALFGDEFGFSDQERKKAESVASQFSSRVEKLGLFPADAEVLGVLLAMEAVESGSSLNEAVSKMYSAAQKILDWTSRENIPLAMALFERR